MLLNKLIPYAIRLKTRFPKAFTLLTSLGRRYLGGRLGLYPRLMAGEVAAAASVLRGGQWNMTAGRGLAHERLEAAFAEYIGVPHAIAVNTGGMALQMSIRGLGLKPGDEVIHQVDTCSATALAVMATSCTPVFADVSSETFMLDPASVEHWIGPSSRALIATHMWGNTENMPEFVRIADKHKIPIIEDTCLSLGSTVNGRMAGSFGRVGVYSFGCNKPIQAGEGGMIVTSDEGLARELRAMRHWGDRTLEYGVRDTLVPAWNGRMSEIVAAVVHEQLKGYPRHLASMRDAVSSFIDFTSRIDGIDVALGHATTANECSFTQVTLKLDEAFLGSSKNEFKDALYARGIPVWHANFELINSLTLFRDDNWRPWLPAADVARTRANYHAQFPVAQQLYDHGGLGLGKMNFLSTQNLKHLQAQIEQLCLEAPR